MTETLARTQRSGALRISEAAAIYWDDIGWKNRSINIHRSVMWPRRKGMTSYIKEGFKNGDEKVVPIMPDAYALLKELHEEKSCELVFHQDGKPLEYRFIQHAYDSACRKAKIDFSGTHVLRRTGASWVLNSTGDIDLAKELLGNTTWTSVKPYAQRESKALSDYNDKLWKAETEKPKLRPKLNLVR